MRNKIKSTVEILVRQEEFALDHTAGSRSLRLLAPQKFPNVSYGVN